MTAVAKWRALGVFAGAKAGGSSLGVARWQKIGALMGTIAKRLAIALSKA